MTPEQIDSLPAILDFPPKILPIIFEFNNYSNFLIEGGRGSGKTSSAARLILYLSEIRTIKTVCGRETESKIEDSVYTVFTELIKEYNLNFKVLKNSITHNISGSTIVFAGFREQERVGIKGLEAIDILWIDEAEAITAATMSVIMPTIREDKAITIFTMNRFLREDAVIAHFKNDKDTLHITVNYTDNQHCSSRTKKEAENCKERSQREYEHVWLGHPLSASDDHLFDFGQLHKAMGREAFGEPAQPQRVLGIDFAAQGNDLCVGVLLDRASNQHWRVAERIPWDESNTMVSVGKIVDMIGKFKPDITMLDIGGMGKVVYDRLLEVMRGQNNTQLFPFDGATTGGIDTTQYGNTRAAAYFKVKEWLDSGFLCLEAKDKEILDELEKIKISWRSTGKRFIQSKRDMKKELRYSPDNADALMMAIWGVVTYLGVHGNSYAQDSGSRSSRRISSSRREIRSSGRRSR